VLVKATSVVDVGLGELLGVEDEMFKKGFVDTEKAGR